MMPSSMAPNSMPGRLPSPPSTQIANTRPIYSRPIDGSTGWMTIRNAPASDAVAIETAKAMRLIRIGSAPMSWSASWSCDTAMMARPVKVRVRNSCRAASIESDIRHQHAQRQVDHADVPARLDIARLDVAVIAPEHQDQAHLGDEQDAEEEGKAAQRIL